MQALQTLRTPACHVGERGLGDGEHALSTEELGGAHERLAGGPVLRTGEEEQRNQATIATAERKEENLRGVEPHSPELARDPRISRVETERGATPEACELIEPARPG